MNLEDFINQSIKADSPFVSYRLPEMQVPVTLKPQELIAIDDISSIQGTNGFIIQPFVKNHNFPTLFFSGGKQFRGWNFGLSDDWFVPNDNPQVDAVPNFSELSESQYNHLVDQLINSCKSEEIEKVVLSRVIQKDMPRGFSFGKFFSALCKTYPFAFVYILNLGNGQTWAGATPETLLTSLLGKCETMALAGTVANNWEQNEQTFDFTSKELREQEMVTNYIVNILESNNVQGLIKHNLEVRDAGPVKHLQTRFSFDLPFGESPIKLALKLHPTPAVCGLPPKKALELINEAEPHNRAYYSGFLGPINNKTNANLFVNLRCMVLVGQKAFVFAGGGITSGSSAADEWQETNLKAETLLRIIEQQS